MNSTDDGRGRFVRVRTVFLRMLAVIYAIAFASIAVQIVGLLGTGGILPASTFLHRVGAQVGTIPLQVPTLFWVASSDLALQAVAWLGFVAAIVLLVGKLPRLMLLICWVCYLSICSVGRSFLAFQWDNLLLEAGFLALLLPGGIRAHRHTIGHDVDVWLFRLLLFKLLFSSGWVKLASGDPTWSSFRALDVHYETQPLPTIFGWYAHQLPDWFHRVSVGGMFFIELVLPWFIFLPRRWRAVSFFPQVALQVAILVTGNYCFFNWLTIALCFFLLDDEYLTRGPLHWFWNLGPVAVGRTSWWLLPMRSVRWTLIAAIVILNTLHFTATFFGDEHLSDGGVAVMAAAAPFRSVNDYGLFAVMTTTRPEIVIEGSHDQLNWLEYGFHHKPGDLQRAPTFVAPHQPRLDWQMWFAALGTVDHNPWFVAFMERLAKGRPDVLALIETNPFPDRPPQHLRAMLYRYRFSDPETRRRTGSWWTREPLGTYWNPEEVRSP